MAISRTIHTGLVSAIILAAGATVNYAGEVI